jgi:hypothetical protein
LLAHKIAGIARDLEASAEDAGRVRRLAATLHSYAAELHDREHAIVPPALRVVPAAVVNLEERRAQR